MRSIICVLGALALIPLFPAAQSSTGAGAGADMLQQIRERQAAERGAPPLARNLTYRVINGAHAKDINSYCAGLWSDDEEVLVLDYGLHTYLMRTGFGDIGRSCRVR